MNQTTKPTIDRLSSAHATCGEPNVLESIGPNDILTECSAIQGDWSESDRQRRRTVASSKQRQLFDIVQAHVNMESTVAA